MSEKKKEKMEFDPSKFYGDPRFYDILKKLADLHSKKNFQYASQGNPLGNFERVGRLAGKLFKEHVPKPLGVGMMFMAKQIDAVYDIVGEGKVGTLEALEDKFQDIACYSIICMILLSENNDKKTA